MMAFIDLDDADERQRQEAARLLVIATSVPQAPLYSPAELNRQYWETLYAYL